MELRADLFMASAAECHATVVHLNSLGVVAFQFIFPTNWTCL